MLFELLSYPNHCKSITKAICSVKDCKDWKNRVYAIIMGNIRSNKKIEAGITAIYVYKNTSLC